MDRNTLIDLNSPNPYQECCFKLASPLIPPPNIEHIKCLPRLSDSCDPFDKVLINITNRDDPFEIVSESAFCNRKELLDSDEKENIGHLISPLETPMRRNKNNMQCKDSNPDIKISDSNSHETKLCNSLQNESQVTNSANNSSLQCLTDSILSTSIVKGDICELSVKAIFPNSVLDSEGNSLASIEEIRDSSKEKIKSCNGTLENDKLSEQESYNTLNNAFINTLKYPKLSANSTSSTNNLNSFHVESLGTSDISNIFPSVSSINSKENKSGNIFNNAFCNETSDCMGEKTIHLHMERKCMSARKPTKHELILKYLNHSLDIPKKQVLNNSFGGFNNKCSVSTLKKQETATIDDSVFMEASYLGNMFSKFARELPDNSENEDELLLCSPPWFEENINFKYDEEEKEQQKSDQDECTGEEKSQNNNIYKVNNEEIKTGKKEMLKQDEQTITDNEESNDFCLNKIDKACEADKKSTESNIRSLLHNISAILKCDGQEVNEKELGEKLLKSLALALNMENSNVHSNYVKVNGEDTASQVLLDDPEIQSKIVAASLNKKIVPIRKNSTITGYVAPARIETNLKPKVEKEKTASMKGPLKAVIPVKNMAKPRKNFTGITSKLSTFVTPPKYLQVPSSSFQKRTSTPNELKIKAPMAQSTPDNCRKNVTAGEKHTSVGNSKLVYSFSPLVRPASTGNISCVANDSKPVLNKNTSGSAPTISDVSLNECGYKQNINTSNKSNSTTTMSRRRSASDLKRNNSLKPPTQLKRSSSFQNKVSTVSENVPLNQGNEQTSNVNNTIVPKIRTSLISKSRRSLPKALMK